MRVAHAAPVIRPSRRPAMVRVAMTFVLAQLLVDILPAPTLGHALALATSALLIGARLAVTP
jgi:flagellar biosynthesis protein FliR